MYWNPTEMHLVCVTCVPPENSHLEWIRFPHISPIIEVNGGTIDQIHGKDFTGKRGKKCQE